MTNPADKIIVALDVATEAEALDLVKQLSPQIRFFKVGLQLYTAAGPQVVQKIKHSGGRVFLDLKLHDIPNTVTGGVRSAVALGVDMLTVHLSGGEAMIRVAVEAGANRVKIIGVTALTSLNDQILRSIGVEEAIGSFVLRLARLGVACGVHGVVASALEASMLRKEFGPKIRIITPGIRPKWAGTDDQSRATTPETALAAGSDYLVIGRPITAHPAPIEAVQQILAEFQGLTVDAAV